MNKFTIFLVLGAVITAVVAVWLLVSGTPLETPTEEVVSETPTNESSESPAAESTVVGEGSLLTLLEGAQPYECEIEYVMPGASEPLRGTYFTASGKMRGDFLVPELGEGVVSSVILRDDTLYTWSIIDGEGYGMKMPLSIAFSSSTTAEVNDAARTPVPLDQSVSYRCERWSQIDGSVFEPPSDVLFRDYESVMTAGMEDGTTFAPISLEGKSPCDLCAQVAPGPGQDECKKNFQCE